MWVCLHGYDQPVAGLAAQLVDLDTPEYLLILPEALSRHARPEILDRSSDALGAWFALHSAVDDLADVTIYLDGFTSFIFARCPAGTLVTVLGYGHSTAAGWLAGNHLAYDKLIFYATVFPPDLDRHVLFTLGRWCGDRIVLTRSPVRTVRAASGRRGRNVTGRTPESFGTAFSR